jgi:hypothetical protein
MDYDPPTVAEQECLLLIRDRIREIARDNEWFKDALPDAHEKFQSLVAKASKQRNEVRAREVALATELLRSGWIIDPAASGGSPRLIIKFHTLWRKADALLLRQWRRTRVNPANHARRDCPAVPNRDEQELAAVGLETLHRDEKYRDPSLAETEREMLRADHVNALEAGTHENLSWAVEVVRPSGWSVPPDPWSFERKDLQRFSDEDYLTIALFRLGGLADVGNPRPFVPEPTNAEDSIASLRLSSVWWDRFPVRIEDIDSQDPPLIPWRLPPSVAEHMLETVEVWVKCEAPSRSVQKSAKPAGPKRPKRPYRSKADRVREILTGEVPYGKSKTDLAYEVGYTHSASLKRVKNFDRLWSENDEKLSQLRAEGAKRMTRRGE